MKPSVRLAKVVTRALITGPSDPAAIPTAQNPTAETFTRWCVLPTDLDFFGHMNNSRYLMLMDYGRVDYMCRLGLLPTVIKSRWIMPVGSAQVDFLISLKPFEKFEIGTQAMSWDDRWFFIRQTFRTPGSSERVCATAYLKVIFRSPAGLVPPAEVVKLAVGAATPPPPLDDEARVRFGLPPRLGVLAPQAAS